MRFLGELHFEPLLIHRPTLPLDSRWYRRRWRWRTRAVWLALLVGLAGGAAFSSATDAAPPGAAAIPPGPSGRSSEAETAAPRRADLGTEQAAKAVDGEAVSPPADPAPTVSPPPSARAVWQYDPEVSFYGPGFYGRRTACGLALTTSLIGVAHRSLPCGTLVDFRWRGRVVRAPVVDRGPYVAGRQWDLTGGLCLALEHCWTGPIEWRLVRP